MVWHAFNNFLVHLDKLLNDWAERTTLFCGHLIHNGSQSQTVKSYVSAIKAVLKLEKYKWDDDRALLSSIIRACRIRNDVLHVRMPIRLSMLEVLLFELKCIFHSQPYLEKLYKAIFCLTYYGMMQIGELTYSQHTLKACNLHLASNKDKLLLVLYTSKTHTKAMYPQQIKITSNKLDPLRTAYFCPFTAVREFMRVRRPGYFSKRRYSSSFQMDLQSSRNM